ncbi:ADP-ribosylglycohydrolase family protein [Planococcus halotolerans]|uniref:ADP-ribosylglycohydrolase family protein n=1 Tax=Planococcus halotolerans TaxID=2233542 RepID=UPI001092DE83|nr:ADP-ribosylglycohydrolase family protein [Planococcus halotolerans]QHJ69224.1 ADP-ribosylglycohydrolase family protein [Planococcus halotolerans]
MPNKIERFIGSFIGLAVGDAVGVTLEFKAPGTFEPIDDMLGGGPFNLPIGYWTDDTSMALCLAQSLVCCKGFDAQDQMKLYTRWYRKGYMSSLGYCFDIGGTVEAALEVFESTGNPYSGSKDPFSAGNGSLMRLCPVPLFYSRYPEKAIHMSGESSRTTHGTQEAVDACRYFEGLLVGAINGVGKEELLNNCYSPIGKITRDTCVSEKILQVAQGSFKNHNPPNIKGTGYVVNSLEAALWAFYHGKSYREGLLLAVNLGDDADTTGAIYGQLAGAYYGIKEIPEKWSNNIVERKLIEDLAIQLYESNINLEL